MTGVYSLLVARGVTRNDTTPMQHKALATSNEQRETQPDDLTTDNLTTDNQL